MRCAEGDGGCRWHAAWSLAAARSAVDPAPERAYGYVVSRVIGRWWLPGVVLVGAVFLLTVPRSVGSSVVAVIMLVYAWVLSPAFFPKGADLEVALESAAAGRAPLVLWKPGVHPLHLATGSSRVGRSTDVVGRQLGQRASKGRLALSKRWRPHDADGHLPQRDAYQPGCRLGPLAAQLTSRTEIPARTGNPSID